MQLLGKILDPRSRSFEWMEEGKTTSISCSILTIPKNMNHRPKGRVHLSWSRITFVQPLAIYSISACEARHKILLNLFRKKKYGNRWRVFYNKQNKTILSSNYIILHFTSLNQRLIWLDFPLFFFLPHFDPRNLGFMWIDLIKSMIFFMKNLFKNIKTILW